MARRSIALLVTALGMLLATAGIAAADTTDIIQPQNETSDQGFQSDTCILNEEAAPPNKLCSPESPGLFFKKAAGHPPLGFTQYTIQHEPYVPIGCGKFLAEIKEPFINRTIKTVRTDLPPG